MSGLIRLGRTPSGADVMLDPCDPSHFSFSGRTRSGKSIAVFNCLAQLKGLPVVVAGIDPTGVLLGALGEGLGGSRLRALTLRDPERALAVVDELVEIMDDRIDRLLAERRDKFEDYSADFPLYIVVFEEYLGLLSALGSIDKATGAKPADRIETKVRAAVQRLALEGAKVGMRLWIIGQRFDASILSGVLRSQLTTKISFAQDADGLRMLHEGLSSEQIEQASSFIAGQGFVETPTLPLTMFRGDLMTYQQLVAHFED